MTLPGIAAGRRQRYVITRLWIDGGDTVHERGKGKLLFNQEVKGRTGGGGEIRTLGGLSPSLVFKTSAFNHSATPPRHGQNLTPMLRTVKELTAKSGWLI